LAETVYYEAFMDCDTAVMAVLWADGDVVRIHRRSCAIIGHEKVVRSWVPFFQGALPPEINFALGKWVMSGVRAVEESTTGAG